MGCIFAEHAIVLNEYHRCPGFQLGPVLRYIKVNFLLTPFRTFHMQGDVRVVLLRLRLTGAKGEAVDSTPDRKGFN